MPQYGSKRDWEQTPREASQPALDCKQSCPGAATRRIDAQCQSQVTLHDLIWFTPRGSSNSLDVSMANGAICRILQSVGKATTVAARPTITEAVLVRPAIHVPRPTLAAPARKRDPSRLKSRDCQAKTRHKRAVVPALPLAPGNLRGGVARRQDGLMQCLPGVPI
jgi:hypothetical protein